MKKLFALFGIFVCVIYLLNPGFGIIEFIPDNVPIVGNVDEGIAGSLLMLFLQALFKRKKNPQS